MEARNKTQIRSPMFLFQNYTIVFFQNYRDFYRALQGFYRDFAVVSNITGVLQGFCSSFEYYREFTGVLQNFMSFIGELSIAAQ